MERWFKWCLRGLIPMAVLTVGPNWCPENYYYSEERDYCYGYFNQTVTFQQASGYCRNDFGELAKFPDNITLDWLNRTIIPENLPSDYVWYAHPDSEIPECSAIQYNQLERTTEPCSHLHPFVCQMPAGSHIKCSQCSAQRENYSCAISPPAPTSCKYMFKTCITVLTKDATNGTVLSVDRSCYGRASVARYCETGIDTKTLAKVYVCIDICNTNGCNSAPSIGKTGLHYLYTPVWLLLCGLVWQ